MSCDGLDKMANVTTKTFTWLFTQLAVGLYNVHFSNIAMFNVILLSQMEGAMFIYFVAIAPWFSGFA